MLQLRTEFGTISDSNLACLALYKFNEYGADVNTLLGIYSDVECLIVKFKVGAGSL